MAPTTKMLVVSVLVASSALRAAHAVMAVTKPTVVRVIFTDMGRDAAWFPGDKRTLRDLTPMQQATVASCSLERLVNGASPLVAIVPAVSDVDHDAIHRRSARGPKLRTKKGGCSPTVYANGVHDEGTRSDALDNRKEAFFRAVSATSRGGRVAALCAVSNVRTEGNAFHEEDQSYERRRRGTSSSSSGGVRLDIASADVEVVGRITLRDVETIPPSVVAEDRRHRALSSLGGILAPVGTPGTPNAVIEDAWIDEFEASPVHALHRLRPVADECARLHDEIRRLRRPSANWDRINEIFDEDLAKGNFADFSDGHFRDVVGRHYSNDVDVDRSLFELAKSALHSIELVAMPEAAREKPRDAYGNLVEPDPEVDLLRCVSFAAWRALRAYSRVATPSDVAWAFASRSTLERLSRAETILRQDLDALRAAAAAAANDESDEKRDESSSSRATAASRRRRGAFFGGDHWLDSRFPFSPRRRDHPDDNNSDFVPQMRL